MHDERLRHWARRLNDLAGRGRPCFFLLDFELEHPRAWTLDDPELPHFSFPDRLDRGAVAGAGVVPNLAPTPLSVATYRRAFATVQAGLRHGDSFLTNLTFPVPVRLDTGLATVYATTEAKYRIHLPDRFVCFSPETFITIDARGYVESRPMKGTALDTPADRAALLANPKEIAEHATIVDLIRNDLSRIAKRVRVTEYRYLRAISTARGGLVQTSSKIGGQLPPDWPERLGDLLLDLLPAGSVAGAPKPATLALIRAAEGVPRAYYCGIGGYFDGRKLDTCVLIRLIARQPDGSLRFHSGGGVTAQSKWADEYAELMAKVRLPLAAGSLSLH